MIDSRSVRNIFNFDQSSWAMGSITKNLLPDDYSLREFGLHCTSRECCEFRLREADSVRLPARPPAHTSMTIKSEGARRVFLHFNSLLSTSSLFWAPSRLVAFVHPRSHCSFISTTLVRYRIQITITSRFLTSTTVSM